MKKARAIMEAITIEEFKAILQFTFEAGIDSVSYSGKGSRREGLAETEFERWYDVVFNKRGVHINANAKVGRKTKLLLTQLMSKAYYYKK